jgi:hypothetical protein
MRGRTWIFDTHATWSATVDDVPRGDRNLAWFEAAIPQIAAAKRGRATEPSVVVAHITAQGLVGAKGRAKPLLDALHDDRRTGPKYADLGWPPPLRGDSPPNVRGLAVEVRAGEPDRVEYRLGSDLVIKGEPVVGAFDVDVDCPNDIGTDSAHNARLRGQRVEFARAVAAEWASLAREVPPDGVAVVIRHRPGRDEDNTWEGWLGALTGASWARDLWPDGAPLAGRRLAAVASVSDPALDAAVRYELIAPTATSMPVDGGHAEQPIAGSLAAGSDEDYSELLTEEQFLGAIRAGDSIVITDPTRPPVVHRPDCHAISRDYFIQKVVENRRRNGSYFRARNTRIAEEVGGAARCGTCGLPAGVEDRLAAVGVAERLAPPRRQVADLDPDQPGRGGDGLDARPLEGQRGHRGSMLT